MDFQSPDTLERLANVTVGAVLALSGFAAGVVIWIGIALTFMPLGGVSPWWFAPACAVMLSPAALCRRGSVPMRCTAIGFAVATPVMVLFPHFLFKA